MTTITFVGWPTSGIVSPHRRIPMLMYALSACTLPSRTPSLNVVAPSVALRPRRPQTHLRTGAPPRLTSQPPGWRRARAVARASLQLRQRELCCAQRPAPRSLSQSHIKLQPRSDCADAAARHPAHDPETRVVPLSRRSVTPLTTGGVCSMPAHAALWKTLNRPTSKGAGHSEEATTTRGLDGHP